MAEPIRNRKAQVTQLRATQQDHAQKKRDLVNQQKEDLQSLRSFYADANRELERDQDAAVNHIRSKQVEGNAPVDGQPSVERKATYNRRGQTQSKPTVQNFETKETDSFYQIRDRGSRISENNNSYVIEAYVPEHEQNNLRVTIQKNKAVISGQRRHADEVDEGQKKLRTNNFQTFREEFKFDRPVSNQGMTRERVGDFIRFSIPKLEAIENPEE